MPEGGAEVVLSETGPNGNVQAILEDDGRVVYLYLRFMEVGGWVNSVWVRNHAKAPAELDREGLKKGIAPMMPVGHCRHPGGAGPLIKDDLELVWLPEGNGVALYGKGEMLVAIPPWCGRSGARGYARDARGEGAFAWELTADNPLHARFAAARRTWGAWEAGAVWPKVQAAQMDAYEARFGKHSNYYAIDGDQWPPKALIRISGKEREILATVGVCMRPQPEVEMAVEDPRPLRRIEIGIALAPGDPPEWGSRFAEFISAQADLPWDRYTWLGHGHSIGLGESMDVPYTTVLLARSDRFGPAITLPDFEDDPVNLLWMVPITRDELARAKEKRADSVLAGIPYPRVRPSR